MRIVITLFVLGHGLVHAVMWALPFSQEALDDIPMDPSHSWLLGDTRAGALGLAVVTTAAFAVAAASYAFDAAWWPWAMLVAAGLSILLLALFFSRWWVIGLAIDAALVVAAVRTLNAT